MHTCSLSSLLPGWLAEDSLPELVNLLCKVETKWYHIGLQLRMPPDTLLCIEEDYQKTKDRFTRMLEEWLRTQKPTKKDLVEALRSEVLQENRLADQVARWIPLSSPWQGECGPQQGDSSRLQGPANVRITLCLSASTT